MQDKRDRILGVKSINRHCQSRFVMAHVMNEPGKGMRNTAQMPFFLDIHTALRFTSTLSHVPNRSLASQATHPGLSHKRMNDMRSRN